MNEIFAKTKKASRTLAALTDNERNEVLTAVADAICSQKDRILKANSRDLQRMEPANPLYDRQIGRASCRERV